MLYNHNDKNNQYKTVTHPHGVGRRKCPNLQPQNKKMSFLMFVEIHPPLGFIHNYGVYGLYFLAKPILSVLIFLDMFEKQIDKLCSIPLN